MTLLLWLQRRKPERVVAHLRGGEKLPLERPASRPWTTLDAACAGALRVEGFCGDKSFLWLPSRETSLPAASPVAAELAGLREVIGLQRQMLRDVIGAQSLALSAVRRSAAATMHAQPDPDEGDLDGGDPELDRLARQAFMQFLASRGGVAGAAK